jgi:hypothetical protein
LGYNEDLCRAIKILRTAGDDGSISGVRLHNGEISNANLNSAKQEGSFKVKASLRANRDPHGDKLVVFFQGLHFTAVEKLEQDTFEQAGNSPSADLSLAHDTTPKIY